jgi:hypothetical protein
MRQFADSLYAWLMQITTAAASSTAADIASTVDPFMLSTSIQTPYLGVGSFASSFQN